MYYYSLNDYLTKTYGEKLYKLSININVTCPNRDGTLSDKGCIFCSEGGRTKFSTDSLKSVTQQLDDAKALISAKTSAKSFIAYFQSYTNTYGDIDYLRKVFFEAASRDEIKIISIGTRADCLGTDVLQLLRELNEYKPVWVELGLQTSNDSSAKLINRGYPLSVFDEAVDKLNFVGCTIIAHVIIGIPGEGRKEVFDTIEYINAKKITGIKFHLMHVLKNTVLYDMYMKGAYTPLTKQEYIDILTDAVERLRAQTVIHRLTGDGDKNSLVAPLFSADKKSVLNAINKTMKLKDTTQGKYFLGE